MTQRQQQLALYLAALAGNDRTGYIEVRSKALTRGGMEQAFFRTTRLDAASELIVGLGRRTDVYVGQAPRSRKAGTADAVEQARVLWVDCDDAAAVHALSAFDPAPSIIVKSGGITDGAPHVHAAWQLREPLSGERVEIANRRVAHALGADMRSTDRARILRPPFTTSFKHARPVELLRLEPTSFTATEIVGELPDPEPSGKRPGGSRGSCNSVVKDHRLARRLEINDPLLAIPASEYVPALTGRELSRDGKVCCPFHDDGTPSLHAYSDAERGWCCFGGCGGGTIIDFGAKLYGITPRGRGFHDVRRRLAQDLLGAIARAA